LKKTVENLVNKWKVILHKAKNIDESFLLKGENVSRRNNTRKNLLKYLEMSLKDKDDEAEIKNLKIKIVEIEDKLNETLKGEAPYLNRVLEIIHNLKDEKNEEFRENIINGKIKPEELCTMNSVDMLSKNKQKEIEKEKEKKVDEVRTDWQEKHGQVTEGVYKCKVCGGRKTIQHEQQTRSADEPMTLFITCLNCKNTWRG
jgi:transcription elongation factor S-II